MALYAEVWARPGAPTFGRVIDFIPNPYQTFHDGLNIVGDGVLQVPSSFDRFDEILLIDEATPANCVSSLVRIFDDSDPDNPIFEWLPSAILPTTDKFDPNVDISGEGIKSIMNYARVEAYDWDGSLDFECSECDWVYGGPNIIVNGSFENSGNIQTVYELFTEASAGTFTISDGTDTTSALAFNASASTIETALQNEITAITDVVVGGSGTSDDPWVIQLVNPAFGVTLTVDGSSLTPANSETLTEIEAGGLDPAPAMKSQAVSTGVPKIHGAYDIFEVSDEQAHTGTYSLKIDPAAVPPRYAGVQWVVRVKPGQLYQASIWVYPTSATDEYRFVMRAPGGGTGASSAGGVFIASDTGALSGTTYPANQWSEVTIDDIEIPEGITELIFRFANVDASGDPSIFYVDDAVLQQGQRADTIGKIMGDLYEDATSEHAGRIVWEDEANPGNPYLTLDFTDTVDSAGNAWTHPEIEVKLWMRMTYLQVLDQFTQTYGYEWRVVPNNVETGTWQLQLYNPGGMQVDYTTAATPGIQTGARDTRRSVRRFVPAGTQYLVEGTNRITGRDEDTDLSTALGRIETSRISRQLPSIAAVGDAAFEDKVDALVNGLTYTYELTDPIEVPLADYLIGDALHIEDPPEVSDNARLIDVECVVSPNATEFEVQFSPQSAAGS